MGSLLVTSRERFEHAFARESGGEVYCPSCGEPIKQAAEICPECGVQTPEGMGQSPPSDGGNSQKKNPTLAAVLSFVIPGVATFTSDPY